GRVLPQFVEDVLDRGVELRIFAVGELGRVVDDLDVGIDAVALNAPGAVGVVVAEGGHGGVAAVDQAGVAGDADQAAPGSRADELAEPGPAEIGREGVAAR